MWGFTPTQVDEVGDMADSHPQRLFFSPNGHLYMFGDSDGGNTPYRHSPHTPGGKFTNGELSGTAFTQMWRAFRSVRMLFVARIDPANGDVLRGSFFYGMWYNEEANRQEIGDAQALGLSVDKDDRVYLTGIMRCNIPFTENAVHKQSAPIDRRGYWNNHVATDEAYLAILDRNFTRLAFASGFNQQGSPDAWSRGLAVAAGGNGAVMVGTVRSRPEHPVSHRVFLRGALQDSWGGDQDGLLVTLHRGLIDHDIMKHTREVFALQLPGESEGRKALLEARALPAALAQLQEQSEPQLARYQAAVEHSGKISLSRAMSYLAHNPFITQQSLQGIVRLWDGSVIAEQAKKALDEINKDPEIRETLAVGRARSAAMEILSGLVEVPQAEQASLLDRNYARRNGRILQRFQQAVMAVYKTWPEHAFTKELLSVASSFAVPITDQDHHMLKYYGQLMQLQDRLRAPGGVPADAENDHFRRLNDNVLKEMRQLIRTMQREDRRHPFTLGGENLAARLNLSLN
ncbi:MAG: hypothetical protein EA402_06125 [Planctomycetota bacterium]|nr:MAG: hypothetical protein EA402_06125 [Planctomycetota bacterium]